MLDELHADDLSLLTEEEAVILGMIELLFEIGR
jgi:hypothetical protein